MKQPRNTLQNILLTTSLSISLAVLNSCDSIKASADLTNGRLKSGAAVQKAREQAGGNFALAFWDPFISIYDFEDNHIGRPMAYHPGEPLKPKTHHPAQIGLLVQPEFVAIDSQV